MPPAAPKVTVLQFPRAFHLQVDDPLAQKLAHWHPSVLSCQNMKGGHLAPWPCGSWRSSDNTGSKTGSPGRLPQNQTSPPPAGSPPASTLGVENAPPPRGPPPNPQNVGICYFPWQKGFCRYDSDKDPDMVRLSRSFWVGPI